MVYGTGGLTGGAVRPDSGGIRPPIGEGQGVARPQQPGAGQRIPDGSLVEGLVTSKEGEGYLVRIGGQTLNARSTIPLFVGQRFRAVWDGSTSPPMLRLQMADMSVLAKFTGRDQQIAFALASRGLPLKDEVIWGLRQQWMQSGGDPAKLGALVELWARGASMTEGNVALLSWYMDMSPETAMQIWRRIRERLHSRKFSSPKEMLSAIKGDGDDEVKKFLQAHSLAGRPARRGMDPALLLAPAWWPVEDDGGRQMMARVSFSSEEHSERKVWWLAFELDGNSLGLVLGDVMTNGRALSVNIKLKDSLKIEYVESNIETLREDLAETSLTVQHIGVGVYRPDVSEIASKQGLDVEA